MGYPEWEGAMAVPPWGIQSFTYNWLNDYGEWPTVNWLADHVAEKCHDNREFILYDIGVAIQRDYVYGLPTVVAMRLGEALGDWRDPLPKGDNGFRIAVQEERWHELPLFRPKSRYLRNVA